MASFGIELLKRVLPADTPRLAAVQLDWHTAAFTAVAIVFCALLCGVIPGFQLASRVKIEQLSGGERSIGGPRERLRALMVVFQVAVSVVLLVAAGLLGGSYLAMRHAPLGFRPDQTLSFSVAFPWDTPASRLRSFTSQSLERVRALPGVQSAGIIDRLPLHGGSQSGPVLVRGVPLSPASAERAVSWRTATPGYFAAAGVPVLRGSVFEPYRGPQGPQVALINQHFARLYFGDPDPIGHEISRREGDAPPAWVRVVGVFGDVRQKPSDAGAEPEVCVPWGATYWPVMNFVVRTAGPSRALLPREIRQAVQPLTEQDVIDRIAPLGDLIDRAESAPRNRAWLLVCFAIATTALAGIGIFGLLSQEVVRRTPEFGVRIALGAVPRDLLWSTTFRAMRLVAIGLLGGIALSLLVTGLIEKLVFPGASLNSASYAVTVIVMLAAAFLASWLPALRASRIEPVRALRGE